MDYRSKILVVDDDPFFLKQIERTLSEDYAISTAASGAEALDYLSGDNWIDLILLDVLMPELDGHAALDAMRKLPRHAKTPVIFLTSQTEPEAEVKGLDQGADYITKPCSPLVLKSRIERALRTAGCLDREKLESLPQALSEMEYRAAVLIAQGRPNEEIAQVLSYTLGSVKNLVARTMGKLVLSNRKEIEQYMK